MPRPLTIARRLHCAAAATVPAVVIVLQSGPVINSPQGVESFPVCVGHCSLRIQAVLTDGKYRSLLVNQGRTGLTRPGSPLDSRR